MEKSKVSIVVIVVVHRLCQWQTGVLAIVPDFIVSLGSHYYDLSALVATLVSECELGWHRSTE